MAAILLNSGLILVSTATRDQVITALGGAGGVATGAINGVQTTVRAASVAAVADSIEGLRATMLSPIVIEAPTP